MRPLCALAAVLAMGTRTSSLLGLRRNPIGVAEVVGVLRDPNLGGLAALKLARALLTRAAIRDQRARVGGCDGGDVLAVVHGDVHVRLVVVAVGHRQLVITHGRSPFGPRSASESVCRRGTSATSRSSRRP